LGGRSEIGGPFHLKLGKRDCKRKKIEVSNEGRQRQTARVGSAANTSSTLVRGPDRLENTKDGRGRMKRGYEKWKDSLQDGNNCRTEKKKNHPQKKQRKNFLNNTTTPLNHEPSHKNFHKDDSDKTKRRVTGVRKGLLRGKKNRGNQGADYRIPGGEEGPRRQ